MGKQDSKSADTSVPWHRLHKPNSIEIKMKPLGVSEAIDLQQQQDA